MSARQKHRTDQILKLLLQKGSVTLEVLIFALKPSAPSIRGDLVQELLYEPYRYNAAFQTRQHQSVREKRHIGVAAAELVNDDETIGFTAGTTTTWVARSLRHRSNLTVVTNAVNIGMELCNM